MSRAASNLKTEYNLCVLEQFNAYNVSPSASFHLTKLGQRLFNNGQDGLLFGGCGFNKPPGINIVGRAIVEIVKQTKGPTQGQFITQLVRCKLLQS